MRDRTKDLLVGTSDIYVIAETTDPTTGKAQKKPAYVSVKSVTLSLSCGYNLAATIQPARRPLRLSLSGLSLIHIFWVPLQLSDANRITAH